MNNKGIHYNSIVVDCHNDTMMKVIDKETWLPVIDIGKLTDNHIDIAKLMDGGINVAFFSSFTEGYHGNIDKSISRTLALINALYFTEKNNPDTFQIATSINDIDNIVKENRVAALATIEGAYGINEDNYLELLRQFYDLGIGVIGLTWNYSNNIGEGCNRIYGDKTPSQGGLTNLGERVVKEMNRLGILVDVSHLSEETFWGVISTTNSPIIASHSGVYNLKNHQRNLNDQQLIAIKDNAGVVSVVLFPNFLSDKDEVYVKDFVDHIDYIVDLIGVDHVGIGSDFDGAKMPMDLKDSSQIYKITDELIDRGYEDKDIEKILGGNILRVLREIEDKASYNTEKIEGDIEFADNKIKINFDEDIDYITVNSEIIINGISYQPSIDNKNKFIYYKGDKPLSEKFYVVSLQIDDGLSIKRRTKIIYTA